MLEPRTWNNWETTLPYSLRSDSENLFKLKKAVTQNSQLVAWSWTDLLAFPDREDEEKTLKETYRNTFLEQAVHAAAFLAYAQRESKELAIAGSDAIKDLLLGKNSFIPGIKLTLNDILKTLTGEDFVLAGDPNDNFKNEFTEMFTFRAIINDFVGQIIEIEENKYLALMSYPPRPALSEYTITPEKLKEWAQTPNFGGSSYLPPHWIPLHGS